MIEEDMNGIRERMVSELKPLIASFKTIHFDSFEFRVYRKMFNEYRDKTELSDQILSYFIFIEQTPPLEQIDSTMKTEEQIPFFRKKTINLIFTSLGIIEMHGHKLADFALLFLIANGYQFHVENPYSFPHVKHATSLTDLEKAPLRAKINFAKDNGITFLESAIDVELRNAIAHMKFEIKQIDLLQNQPVFDVYVNGKPAMDRIIKCMKKMSVCVETMDKIWNELSDIMKSRVEEAKKQKNITDTPKISHRKI